MDGKQFDAITQRLTAASTRRRIVGGVLGGAALLTGGALAGLDAEAKKGKGKAKGKGKGKGKNNGGKGKAHGKNKVAICHKTDDNGFQFKMVPAPALKQGHRKHGDTICGEPGTCQTGDATGCNEDGSCIFTTAEDGTACTTEDGTVGTCEAGTCVPTTTPPPAP